MYKPKIGITIGDIHGIGPEIIIKTLNNSRILDMCTPVIFGNDSIILNHNKIIKSEYFDFKKINSTSEIIPGSINLINCWEETVNIVYGNIAESGGQCAHISLKACVNALQANEIDAMVTAPIHKKSMSLADFPYPGHTEFLANAADSEALMILCSDELRVALVTTHIPLKEVAEKITKKLVLQTLKRFNKSLVEDFAIDKPLIAVLGMNPHAGDGGIIGDDEKLTIEPAIKEANRMGILTFGPYAADGFFGSQTYKKFDGILSMYHDQGLVGFKSLSFGEGVNYTAGLPFIRTSPDHGTGFDIAGKNKANESSFRKALFTAIDLYRNRFNYFDSRKNALRSSVKRSERS